MATSLIKKINRLKKEKNAIILAHYYQNKEVQDIADFIGDSLALSQKAEKNDADIILFAGVKFMAETAKILSPQKKVLLPDMEAGCSLADSCKAEDFKIFLEKNPGRTVISYVNTTAEIKALSDVTCTSSNALEIVNSFPKDQKLIFGPDRNLGNYVLEKTGRDILIWNGACHVHDDFSADSILQLKREYKGAKVLVHPECKQEIRELADIIGSTAALLNYTSESPASIFIVATEPGIIYQMEKKNPNKVFLPVKSNKSCSGNFECDCNECEYMKLITLEKIYNCLLNETPEIVMEESLIKEAYKPIKKMLDICENIKK